MNRSQELAGITEDAGIAQYKRNVDWYLKWLKDVPDKERAELISAIVQHIGNQELAKVLFNYYRTTPKAKSKKDFER